MRTCPHCGHPLEAPEAPDAAEAWLRRRDEMAERDLPIIEDSPDLAPAYEATRRRLERLLSAGPVSMRDAQRSLRPGRTARAELRDMGISAYALVDLAARAMVRDGEARLTARRQPRGRPALTLER